MTLVVDYVQLAEDALALFYADAVAGKIKENEKSQARFSELKQNLKLVKGFMGSYKELEEKVQGLQAEVDQVPNAETSRKISLYKRKLAAIEYEMRKLSGYKNSLRGR